MTNTNWQYYGGETTLSYFSQMAGLTVQNFVSAAVGIAVAIALIRGIIARRSATPTLGNFWEDLVRATLLHPAADLDRRRACCSSRRASCRRSAARSPAWPAARSPRRRRSRSSAPTAAASSTSTRRYPFENATGSRTSSRCFLILCIPASLTYTYGRMVGSRRQGWAIFAAMSMLFIASVVVVYLAELHGTPAQHAAGVTPAHRRLDRRQPGGQGACASASPNSALWTAVTTVTSCGAVNAAFESLTGIGGLVPMVDLGYGESVFGGVGTGLYTMLLYVLLAVFIGGLMVGRTPEYLGKKIEAREIKLVVARRARHAAGRAARHRRWRSATKYGAPSIFASGPQGFSESLYAYMSQANNNGSAFAGYTGYFQPNARQRRRPRHHVRRPARRRDDARRALRRRSSSCSPSPARWPASASRPPGLGHDAHRHADVRRRCSVGIVVLIGALTFFPALLLGPVVQGLTDQLF